MMKRTDSVSLMPGMKLAKPIMIGDSILLDQGIILTDQYIDNIRKRRIKTVYIESDWHAQHLFSITPQLIQTPVADIMFSEPAIRSSRITESYPDETKLSSLFEETGYAPYFQDQEYCNQDFDVTYRQAVETFSRLVHSLRSNRKIDEKTVESLVSCIITQTDHSPSQTFELLSNCSLNNYVLSHSLNSTYLSIMLGKRHGFDQGKLVLLGISALLHDIGMLKLDSPCWNKPGKLSEMELLDVKKHTVYGIDTIAACTRFPKEVAYVAYLHHERMDGSGYPKGKRGNLISEFAQIVSLCDVFAAMISERVYRESVPVMESLDYIYTRSNGYFSRKYTDSLVRYMDSDVKPGVYDQVIEMSRQYASQLRISIVDSAPDVKTNILSNTLERHMFTVNTASDYDSITDPSLIILNLHSSETAETYRSITQKQKLSNVPIIVLSPKNQSLITPDERTHILTGNAISYNIVDIIDKVRGLLRG